VNYAILQVMLGHYLKLWQIVDKDGSVFLLRKKKKVSVEWRKIIWFSAFWPSHSESFKETILLV